MIEAECPSCAAGGAHKVIEDHGTRAEVVYGECGRLFVVLLC